MTKHLLIDLDDTLIDTSKLQAYRKTEEGWRYIIKHIDDLPTSDYRPLREIVLAYHKRKQVSIITDFSEKYARAVLRKHGYPPDIPVLSNANKPFSDELQEHLAEIHQAPDSTLLIGDAATDILAAHGAEMTSAAAAWGYSTDRQLEKAEPQRIVLKPEDLEEAIGDFEKGRFSYTPRERPSRYLYMPRDEFDTPDPEVSFVSLGNYYPYSKGYRNQSSKNIVFGYKQAKEVSIEDINNGATSDYFWNGRVQRGQLYIDTLNFFLTKALLTLEEIELEGTTWIIAAPNAFPEYCYKTDINRVFCSTIAKRRELFHHPKQRLIYRVNPLPEAHQSGQRSARKHYKTIGLEAIEEEGRPDTIIIFDDVSTTGLQTKCIAKILRSFGFPSRFYSLTLGQTV